MEIVKLLMSQLSVDEGQAKGGLGSLLGFAKENLNMEDFGKIATSLGGGTEDLINAAPKAEGAAGMLSGITSALGVGGGLGGLAALAGQFKNLGLDADMIGKFAPVVTNFLKDKGGDDIAGLVSGLFNK